MGNSGKPVRYHNDRLASHHIVERLLDRLLRDRVEAGGCFVENQNRRVLHNNTRYGNALTLPSG